VWKTVRPPTNQTEMKEYIISAMEAGALIIAFQIDISSESMILLM